jgi:hypothetical protein
MSDVCQKTQNLEYYLWTFFNPELVKYDILVSLLTMKHFLEVDNEIILLSNGWIWY